MARFTGFAGGKTGRENLRSINTMVTDYRNFVSLVNTETKRIMQEVANMVLAVTMPKVARAYIPEIPPGALQASGRAEIVETSKGFAARVSFGGAENTVAPTKHAPEGVVDYAIILNYDVEGYVSGGTYNGVPNSGPKYRSGEAYFMENGAAESRAAVDAYIKRELRKITPRRRRR